MKTFLPLLVIVCVISACSHNITSKTGYIRPPQNYKFSYAKTATRISNNEIIDTSTVYYLRDCAYYRNNYQYKHTDAIIRFFSDGRFKTWSVKEKVTLEDINNIENGIVGYYILEGRKIKMQLFTDHKFGFTKLEYGYFDENNDLVVINKNPRKAFGVRFSLENIKKMAKELELNPKIYKKTKVNGMKYAAPNW